jgi:aminopeptidase
MRDPRLTKLADVLVNYSTGVRKDQLVRIGGPPVAAPLVLEIQTKVLEAGGHPFIRMAPE